MSKKDAQLWWVVAVLFAVVIITGGWKLALFAIIGSIAVALLYKFFEWYGV